MEKRKIIRILLFFIIVSILLFTNTDMMAEVYAADQENATSYSTEQEERSVDQQVEEKSDEVIENNQDVVFNGVSELSEGENLKKDEKSSESSEEQLKENSWRYENGNVICNEILSRFIDPNAWNKVNGQFVNSDGDVIPGAVKKGIDVSEHDGTINWEQVKADGIDFAILRCGYGSDYINQDDKQWQYNVSECERLKIPYGVYLYSYADTIEKAKSEAQHVLRLLKNHKPAFPVYYDLEDKKVFELSSEMKGQLATIFCDTVSAAGYKVGIYSNLNWWNNYLKDKIFDNSDWSRWVAQYNSTCAYKGSYDMWQCTSSGQVNGINGRVDLNFWMSQSSTTNGEIEIRYDSKTQTWQAYRDGVIDNSYTGVVYYKSAWWYMKNGRLDQSYTGIAYYKSAWWYMKNGRLDQSYTGVAYYKSAWWYMKNGRLDQSYTGIAYYKSAWWYMKNGRLDQSYTGIAYYKSAWWYMKSGRLDQRYNGVVVYEGEEYQVVNGRVLI